MKRVDKKVDEEVVGVEMVKRECRGEREREKV